MTDDQSLVTLQGRPTIYRVRGIDVILDSDLATALGMTTKRLNERIRRNADLVDHRHCFHLTEEEFTALRSQIATSKKGRGGRQYVPRVFTARGVARVPAFINTAEARRATDLIIDTFLMVQQQIAAGRRSIEIAQPSRYHLGDDIAAQAQALRKRLLKALDSLLDTVIDIRTKQTVHETAKDLTAGLLEHARERLREKGLENLKLEAETRLVLAEAEKVAAAVRRSDAEVEGLHLDNLTKRIGIVRELIVLQRELEPNQVVQLLDGFETGRPIDLPQPSRPSAPRWLPAPNEDE